jgi:hypothetical protein
VGRAAFRRACHTAEEARRDVRDGVDTTEAGRQDLGRHCCYHQDHCAPHLDLRAVEVDLHTALRNEDASFGEDAVGDGGGDVRNVEAVVHRDPCFQAVEVRTDPRLAGIRTEEEVRKDPKVVEDTDRDCCHCCCCYYSCSRCCWYSWVAF